MIVVFDTNIWLSQLGMQSPAASAVRFFLKHNNHRLALPEVIRLEVERNLQNKLISFIEDIRTAHRQLLTAFGTLREIVLPSGDDVQRMVSEVFKSTGVELIHIPFSQDSALSSFHKTIQKVPPSDKTQEFKDGVIWADCLRLADADDVTLVTDDRAFFEGRKPENGLAGNLRAEAANRTHILTVVDSVASLLNTIQHQVDFDEVALKDLLLKKAEDNVTTFLRNGFALDDRAKVSLQVFATEHPDKLYFECTVELGCIDSLEIGEDAKIVLEADGFYLPSCRTFEDVNMQNASLVLIDDGVATTKMRGAYAYGAAFIGHREVTNTVRYRL
jgi:hypothetical protein